MGKEKLTKAERDFLHSYLGWLVKGSFRAKKVCEMVSDEPDKTDCRQVVFAVWFELDFQGQGRYLATLRASVQKKDGDETLYSSGDASFLPRVALDCVEDFIGEKYVVNPRPQDWEIKTMEEKIQKLHALYCRDVQMAAAHLDIEKPDPAPLFSTEAEMNAFIKEMEIVR